MFHRILVAVADDAASSAAVGAAAELAAGSGAEVVAVHVWCLVDGTCLRNTTRLLGPS